jgi:hypothetical protein
MITRFERILLLGAQALLLGAAVAWLICTVPA